MKKLLSLLLSSALLFSCALAFTGSGYPAWDGSSAPENGFCGDFGGQKLRLDYDADAKYSNTLDGILQACFFAFDSGEQNYLELYLQMPDDLAAGDVFSARDGLASSSISLYEVSQSSEALYFAGQLIGTAYPGGTDYEIRIDSVDAGTVRGSLTAMLCKIVDNFVTDEYLSLENAAFHFDLPAQAPVPEASAQPFAPPAVTEAPAATQNPFALPESTVKPFALPENTSQPEATANPFQQPAPTLPPKFPVYTMDPHPAFTLPPDYRVI